jgi:choline dehydrogenase-like flavoprotein
VADLEESALWSESEPARPDEQLRLCHRRRGVGRLRAGRLSEDPDASAALIEAGGPGAAEEIHLPVAWSELFMGPYDWDLDSEPEPGLNGRRVYLPRGKVLGGCSSVNAMVYIRGARADYAAWAAGGAAGWGYDEVLPYFRRSDSSVLCSSNTRGITRVVCRWYTSYRPRAPGCMIGARPMLWRLTRGHSRSRSSAEATEARAENFLTPI